MTSPCSLNRSTTL